MALQLFSLFFWQKLQLRLFNGKIRKKAEKYRNVVEQRHHFEIDALQLRIKDEKLEMFRWRLLSMELESKRLQSHVKDLDCEHLKPIIEPEASLLNHEAELHSLREKLALQVYSPSCEKTSTNSYQPIIPIGQRSIS